MKIDNETLFVLLAEIDFYLSVGYKWETDNRAIAESLRNKIREAVKQR